MPVKVPSTHVAPASIAATEFINASPKLLCACKPIGPLYSFLILFTKLNVLKTLQHGMVFQKESYHLLLNVYSRNQKTH